MKTNTVIWFNWPMTEAILSGRKTQTRRIVKKSPLNMIQFIGADNRPTNEFGLCLTHERVIDKHIYCPYGQPGDFLLVNLQHHTLEITAVRVERLQDISDVDAIAEGIESHIDDGVVYYGPYGKGDARPDNAYQQRWESIYGAGSWDINPFVWVIEFLRIEDQK